MGRCAGLFEATRRQEIAAQDGVPRHGEGQGVDGRAGLDMVQSDQHLRTAQKEDDIAGEDVGAAVGGPSFALAAGHKQSEKATEKLQQIKTIEQRIPQRFALVNG